jgi:hemerythrin
VAKAFKPENLEDATDAPIGKHVKVSGLTSAKGSALNGQLGKVVGGTENGRYLVQLSDCTMALRPENLVKQEKDESHTADLDQLKSVGHDDMDSEHETCAQALRLLSEELTVKALKQVRDELMKHFEHEELLLKDAGFGGSGNSECCESDFSAMGSHIKDHKRIISLADDALSKLGGVCATSDALGGTVPKNVASDLCTAFLEHANMYDALYEGKLAAHAA